MTKKKRPLKDLAKRVAKRKPQYAYVDLYPEHKAIREAVIRQGINPDTMRPLEDTSELTAAMEALEHSRFDLEALGCPPNYLQPPPRVQVAIILFCAAFAAVVFLILGDWSGAYPWVQR